MASAIAILGNGSYMINLVSSRPIVNPDWIASTYDWSGSSGVPQSGASTGLTLDVGAVWYNAWVQAVGYGGQVYGEDTSQAFSAPTAVQRQLDGWNSLCHGFAHVALRSSACTGLCSMQCILTGSKPPAQPPNLLPRLRKVSEGASRDQQRGVLEPAAVRGRGGCL